MITKSNNVFEIVCIACEQPMQPNDGTGCKACAKHGAEDSIAHVECTNPACALNLSPGKVPVCIRYSRAQREALGLVKA